MKINHKIHGAKLLKDLESIEARARKVRQDEFEKVILNEICKWCNTNNMHVHIDKVEDLVRDIYFAMSRVSIGLQNHI